ATRMISCSIDQDYDPVSWHGRMIRRLASGSAWTGTIRARSGPLSCATGARPFHCHTGLVLDFGAGTGVQFYCGPPVNPARHHNVRVLDRSHHTALEMVLCMDAIS